MNEYISKRISQLEDAKLDDTPITCEWCGEEEDASEIKLELNLGLICRSCYLELLSRGEKPIIVEG